MKRTTNFQPHAVEREDRPDGSIILRSPRALGPTVRCTGVWLEQWARESPDQVFLAERSGKGWRKETYGSALQKVRALAASLLGRGLNADTPIAVLSGNGVDHGLLALAAQYVGVPTVPLAEQYALVPEAHGRLAEAIDLVRPRLVFVADGKRFAAALAGDALAGIDVVASDPGGGAATALETLLKGDGGVDVGGAHAAVGPDTVAKILMTSGSTSSPKGVLTTQRMMCANQLQLSDSLPFLGQRRPTIVDWLPWNHVFGGSHNFNMMLANGGSLYIDDGKPLKGAFGRSLENLSMVSATLMFNVPIGYAMLLDAGAGDRELRGQVFGDLDLIFYSGASLPQDVWETLERIAMEVKGEVPLMTSSWGMTETAPAALIQQEPTARSGVIGVPMSGVTAKLLPQADSGVDTERYEIRVKGPNVTPGYYKDPERTRASFDEDGFFVTGDAMAFVSRDDAKQGLRFDGRISEDFKLSTGTWVRGPTLKAELLACLAPLAAELVITGHDRDEIGVLIFAHGEALVAAGFADDADNGALTCPLLLADVQRRLRERAAHRTSSSTAVRRALVLAEPPSLGDGEVTAKGSLNWRRVLSRRAALLERLYDNAEPALVRV